MPLSPVHERNLIAARRASSMVRCIFSASRQLANSSRRSLNVGIGFEYRIAQRLYTLGIASVRTLSRSAVSDPGLSPIMCRLRFFRKAVFSLLGVVSPADRSHGFNV